MQDEVTGGNSNLTVFDQWYGVLAWKRGALLVSFVWVAMIVMVIDRQWKKATIWALIGAFFALFGIIHVPEAGFTSFSVPVWENCVAFPGDCWEFADQWMFFLSYIMLAVTFLLIEASRASGFDKSLLPPIADETSEAFQDWFANAAIVIPHPDSEPHVEEFSKTADVSTKTAKTVTVDVEKTAEAEDFGDEMVA